MPLNTRSEAERIKHKNQEVELCVCNGVFAELGDRDVLEFAR